MMPAAKKVIPNPAAVKNFPHDNKKAKIIYDRVNDVLRVVEMRILICVNGVLKHVNTPDSYLRERCANIVDSVRSLA